MTTTTANAFPRTDLAAHLGEPDSTVRALRLLAALRFVAEPDLALAGIGEDVTARMVGGGAALRLPLQRRLTDPAPTHVLALARSGALELAARLDCEPPPATTRSSATRSTMFLDHSLAVSRTALLLAKRLHVCGTIQLASWETDAERLADAALLLDERGESIRQPLVADALAVVIGSVRPEGLLLEIDRGTERSAFLSRKFEGYLAWARVGGPARRFSLPALRVLWIAPDAKRAEKLRETCREATRDRGGNLFWFAAEDALVRDGFLAPVFSTLRKERLHLWP